MCGRYAIAYNSEELPSHFKSFGLEVHPKVNKNDHFDRSFNVAPTTSGAVLRAKDRELRYMKWGLVPNWTKDVKGFNTYRTFNARVENLQESKMWMACCNRKRCVIPVSGYYEWKTKGKQKTPYYVVRKDGKLLFLAGLYDYLESEDLWTYTIITGNAPEELKWLHHRMPVVLEPGTEAWDNWMDSNKTQWTQKELNELLAAHYDDEILQVYQVSTAVNKVGNNSQELVKPILKQDKNKFNVELSATEKRHMKEEAKLDEEAKPGPMKRRKTSSAVVKDEGETGGQRSRKPKKEKEEDDPYEEENDAEVDEAVMKEETGEPDEEYIKGDDNDVEGSMDEMEGDAIMGEKMVKEAKSGVREDRYQSIGERVRKELGETGENANISVKDADEDIASTHKSHGKGKRKGSGGGRRSNTKNNQHE